PYGVVGITGSTRRRFRSKRPTGTNHQELELVAQVRAVVASENLIGRVHAAVTVEVVDVAPRGRERLCVIAGIDFVGAGDLEGPGVTRTRVTHRAAEVEHIAAGQAGVGVEAADGVI